MKFGAVCSLAEIQRIIVYLPAIRISIGLTLAAFISTRTPSGLSTVGFGNEVNFAHLPIHVRANIMTYSTARNMKYDYQMDVHAMKLRMELQPLTGAARPWDSNI